MGLTNFTTGNGPTPPSGGNPPGGGNAGPPAGLPGMPPPAAPPTSDVTDMMTNYNQEFATATPALFREEHITQTMGILISKNKPNPMLVGSAGVGKTVIVEDIARRLANDDVSVPDQLKGYTVWELPVANLIAGTSFRGQLEEKIVEVLDYAADPKNKMILFIDEIHQLQDSSDPTSQKISQIIKPALARGKVKVIGATTTQEYRDISDDPAFARRFSRIIVDELSSEQTFEILKVVRASYMQHYNNRVSLTDDALRSVVTIADTFARADMRRPDTALTLMDKTMADAVVTRNAAIKAAEAKGDTVTASVLRSAPAEVLNDKRLTKVAKRLATGMAVRQVVDMDSVIDGFSQLVGQDTVIDELLDIIQRDQLEIFPRKTPLTLMFAGPSGVGKTESAKIIAQHITGQEPIVLNMAEYAREHDVNKITGSPPGYVGSDSNKELPFNTLESNPYRVILLDELEKAHRDIHRTLLSVFDEGWMRMADGTEVDFSKAIIIATTNAGRDAMTKLPTGFGSQTQQTSRLNASELAQALRHDFEPEFLGRFTRLVQFNALTKHDYATILQRNLADEMDRIAHDMPHRASLLPAPLTDDEIATEVERTYVASMGARPAKQAARRIIEDAMIAALAAQQATQHQVSAPTEPSDDEESA